MNIYEIFPNGPGQCLGTERQIYAARALAQKLANQYNRETCFNSDSGLEVFKPQKQDNTGIIEKLATPTLGEIYHE